MDGSVASRDDVSTKGSAVYTLHQEVTKLTHEVHTKNAIIERLQYAAWQWVYFCVSSWIVNVCVCVHWYLCLCLRPV